MLRVALSAARLWVWAKQGLGEAQHAEVAAASEASAAFYGTAPTGALSAAARVAGFELADFEATLYERRAGGRASVPRRRCRSSRRWVTRSSRCGWNAFLRPVRNGAA